jgi:hypothetical protein
MMALSTLSAVVMAVMAYLIPLEKIDASITGMGLMFSIIIRYRRYRYDRDFSLLNLMTIL